MKAELRSAGCGPTWCSATFYAWANGFGLNVHVEGAQFDGRTYVSAMSFNGKSCDWETPLGCETDGTATANFWLRGETICRDFAGVAKGPMGQAVQRVTICHTFS